ncbi:MAG TPA: hypothetical protein DCZ95_11080 [Verrucomicrobia bacterium]|nr:MAG: hypothetical protein A2X46_07905 [Lentisphaerae bacterium GWF2_57_35]HBA84627.1 hypothetical protein [Verrucomicrobiota bacterium]
MVCFFVSSSAFSGELISGTPVLGAFKTTHSSNSYTFSAMKGDRIKIQMTRLDEVLGPFMQIYAPGGEQNAYADSDCCHYRAAQFNLVATTSGVFRVVCRDRKNAVGSYSLSMIRISGQAASIEPERGLLDPWDKKTGSIEQPGDFDAVVFMGEEGAHVTIRMDEIDPPLNPFMQLYDSEAACIAVAECRPPHRVVLMKVKLPKSGVYTLLCQDRYVSTGRYTLMMEKRD